MRRWRLHLDEMCVKINGATHRLWRAVDHEGEALESLVTKTQYRKAPPIFIMEYKRRFGWPI